MKKDHLKQDYSLAQIWRDNLGICLQKYKLEFSRKSNNFRVQTDFPGI